MVKKSSKISFEGLLSSLRSPLLGLKCLVVSVVLVSSPIGAQNRQAEDKLTLVPGAEVKLSSLSAANWVQGSAPIAFEAGKVYIFECWSTKCVPCIAMIPHVNDLHNKYYDKGLRVHGMSVYEDDVTKVEEFVKNKGDGMSYPVAFTGRGSAFEMEWMKPAGAKGIPHAFIVKDGKLQASTLAFRLTDSIIEEMLSGDEGLKKASATITAAQLFDEKTYELNTEINKARIKKDPVKMEQSLKELKAIDPDNAEIGVQELWLLMVKKQWPAALTALNELPESEAKASFISITGRLTRTKHDHPADFMEARVKLYTDYVLNNEYQIGPNHFGHLSMLQWKAGDKKSAAITANRSVEAAKSSGRFREGYTKAFERFAKEVKGGRMPDYVELSIWIREEIQKSRLTK